MEKVRHCCCCCQSVCVRNSGGVCVDVGLGRRDDDFGGCIKRAKILECIERAGGGLN